ncbi:hypothetical protein KAJ83_12240 [Marivibrio halodurans]|uniref:Type VI secretion system protein n=1 Tax=Marivibrio halodurans TaxID=2039722 RepID=A0A8J7SNN3_9PROT|nr:hypothetical protein [Marivibrio halodurans]MBP5857781.1 hypothetical protein [Marivibrio halodurans]
MTRRASRLGTAMAMSAALLLSACGLIGDDGSVFSMNWVAVASDPDANRNNPTAVDLVLVHDPGVTDAIGALSAGEWFQRKGQFRRDFPKGFKVIGWEVVPAQAIRPRELSDEDLENDEGDLPAAAFVFADYFTPGDHRARLESQRAVRIRLGEDDFTLESFEPPN